jgi:hypothetical protein
MELIDDHRVFLIRLEPDLWQEIQRGTVRSLEVLRPGRAARVPELRSGDVLLLYHPELPSQPPAELSHAVAVRRELSNAAGYALGPLFRMTPPLGRERLLFASQQGSLPEPFRRLDDRTFTCELLASGPRDRFLEYAVTAGISLDMEEGKGGSPVMEPGGETPGGVEFEW